MPHFELRVSTDSAAGRAIAGAFGVDRLSDDAGEAQILEDLQLERASRGQG